MNTDRSFLPYLLLSPLYLAIGETSSTTQPDGAPSPLIFEVSDGDMLVLFSSALNLARFFESEQGFVEISPQAVLAMAKDRNLKIGFDLGQEHGVILEADVMDAVLAHLKDRERLEEVAELEFIGYVPRDEMVESFERVIPLGMMGYLGLDRALGLVLILIGDEETAELEEVREVLLQNPFEEEISFLYFPKSHPRWLKIADEIVQMAVKIEPISHEKKPKVPILKL